MKGIIMRRDWNQKLYKAVMQKAIDLAKAFPEKVSAHATYESQSKLFDKYGSPTAKTPSRKEYKKEYEFYVENVDGMNVDDIMQFLDYVIVLSYAPVLSLDWNRAYEDLKIPELKRKIRFLCLSTAKQPTGAHVRKDDR